MVLWQGVELKHFSQKKLNYFFDVNMFKTKKSRKLRKLFFKFSKKFSKKTKRGKTLLRPPWEVQHSR